MQTLALIGQIILGLYFVQSGLMHFMKLPMMTSYAQSKKLPLPMLAVIVSGLFMLAGGLSVLTGWYVVYGLGLLIVFLFIASFTMHNFWADKDANMKMMNMSNFMKNLALMGSLMMLLMMDNWPWVIGS